MLLIIYCFQLFQFKHFFFLPFDSLLNKREKNEKSEKKVSFVEARYSSIYFSDGYQNKQLKNIND